MAEEKKKKKWIKRALENAHGQFKEKAERSGKSTEAYAREHEGDSGKLGKQSRLAETLMSMHHAHKKNSASNRTMRHAMYEKD